MGHNWIIDVIVDIKSYAEVNDLPQIADELGKMLYVATDEIGSDKKGVAVATRGESTGTGDILSQP